MSNSPQPEPSVLVVSDFTSNLSKVDRHVRPISLVADPTLVCINAPDDLDEVSTITAPSVGPRPVGLFCMLVLALVEAIRDDYDMVASYSLLPYGVISLLAGTITGVPTHLGIIGRDLDEHAHARYGWVIERLIDKFTIVSVPGTAYRDELSDLDAAPGSVEILRNPIQLDEFPSADPRADRPIDLLWVGRFEGEKGPSRFVEIVAEVVDSDVVENPTAVMLGDGRLYQTVEEQIREKDLDDVIELPGWVDEPDEYYRQASVYVLTSVREGLPLSLIEAMASGATCVTPAIGNVGDVAVDGETAIVTPDRSVNTLSKNVRQLLADEGFRRELATQATEIRTDYSYDAAAEDWRRIFTAAGVPSSRSREVEKSETLPRSS